MPIWILDTKQSMTVYHDCMRVFPTFCGSFFGVTDDAPSFGSSCGSNADATLSFKPAFFTRSWRKCWRFHVQNGVTSHLAETTIGQRGEDGRFCEQVKHGVLAYPMGMCVQKLSYIVSQCMKPLKKRLPFLRLERGDHGVHKVIRQGDATRADLAPRILLVYFAVPCSYDVGWLPTPGPEEEPLLCSIDDLVVCENRVHTRGQTVWLHTSCMWDMGGVGTKHLRSAGNTLEVT